MCNDRRHCQDLLGNRWGRCGGQWQEGEISKQETLEVDGYVHYLECGDNFIARYIC